MQLIRPGDTCAGCRWDGQAVFGVDGPGSVAFARTSSTVAMGTRRSDCADSCAWTGSRERPIRRQDWRWPGTYAAFAGTGHDLAVREQGDDDGLTALGVFGAERSRWPQVDGAATTWDQRAQWTRREGSPATVRERVRPIAPFAECWAQVFGNRWYAQVDSPGFRSWLWVKLRHRVSATSEADHDRPRETPGRGASGS